MKETDLSPEDFGALIGVSGMTIRRWMKSKSGGVPKLYLSGIREACQFLIASGQISSQSEVAQAILKEFRENQHLLMLSHLGLSPKDQPFIPDKPESFKSNLSRIGSGPFRQSEVTKNRNKIFSFRKMGDEWRERIDILWSAVRSDQISSMDKFIAFGALFYLLTPIDFVPDHIPVFGLVDDFLILGVAAAFYRNKFASLFMKDFPVL